MEPPDRKKLFDEYFESSYKHGNILTQEQLAMAAEAYANDYQGFLPQNKNAAILDFGCGTGDFLYFLKKQGYDDYYGVDISGSQIEYCRKNISNRAERINGMDFLADKKERYDLIAAHDVLEHIPKSDALRFLELSRNALKKGGTLILRVPNMSNPFGLDARFNDFTHEFGYTNKSLYQVLYLSGFKDIKILPPREITVKSFRNFIRKILVKLLHKAIRFSYYIQDYTVPKNLDKNLIAIARK